MSRPVMPVPLWWTALWVVLVGSFGVSMAGETSAREDLALLSMEALEHRIDAIDTELDQLASFSLQSGVGRVGFRSMPHDTPDALEWIAVDLDGPRTIDQIVLVPTLWRDTRTGFRSDAFPTAFRIVAQPAQGGDPVELASFDEGDFLTPRIAPLVINVEPTAVTSVKVEASRLSTRAWDGKFILQLAEILLFEGPENVALHQIVREPGPERNEGQARSKEFAVDGFLPYLMDAAEGEQSVAFVSQVGIGEQPSLTIDLGGTVTVDGLHLHTVDVSDTVPQGTSTEFAMPRHLKVEGALDAGISDPVMLLEDRFPTIYDTGPIVMRRVPPTPARFVRLTALQPYINQEVGTPGSQIGFAEIEVFSHGNNAALGKPVLADFIAESPDRKLSALTDGRNLYGRLLPLREWMGQLARRHDLETIRPQLLAELNTRYARQKANVERLQRWVAALAVGIVFLFLIARLLRMREVARLKQRLAADLHDELGASVHTIGLLSDLAAESTDDPSRHAELHRRIRSETERSGIAVRHCADMLEAAGATTDLEEEMRRAARRILAHLPHEVRFKGRENLNALPARKRLDLLMFYKECLVNISRHADATEFHTELHATRQGVSLIVRDNGRGLDTEEDDAVPSSLKRRADLLGAQIFAERPDGGGTRIHLQLRIRRRWAFLKR